MAKKKEIDKVKLSAFPEEVDKDGLKWYGEMSYTSHSSHLSHLSHISHHSHKESHYAH